MTTSWEGKLREDLRDLADVPSVEGLADRALAGARRSRRKRMVLAGAGPLALVLLIAIPFLAGPLAGLRLPFGLGPGAPCETATDDAGPPPPAAYPQFVRAVIDKLPPRDDYSLQSAHGVCADPGQPAYGYAVVNVGRHREHGHLTITLTYWTGSPTCAGLASSPQPILFCDEATATTPVVLAQADGEDGFLVTAIHPDLRTVSIGAYWTPFEAQDLRPTVADAELAELLP